MLLVVLSYFETFCIQMVPKWPQANLAALKDLIVNHEEPKKRQIYCVELFIFQ